MQPDKGGSLEVLRRTTFRRVPELEGTCPSFPSADFAQQSILYGKVRI